MLKKKNKSANQLIIKKDRTLNDYLNLFNNRNFFEKNDASSNGLQRYNLLYNLNKIHKEKEEDYRQKMLKQRELSELSECSFIPKTNKDFQYKKALIFNNNNNNTIFSSNNKIISSDKSSKDKTKSEEMTDNTISDLLKRQEIWINKKNKKIEISKQLETNKLKEKFIFIPEINKNNKKIFNDMKIDTQEIVADPESYKEFIDRNKKNQKNLEMNNKEINLVRNSGNKSNKSNKSNYDYTEHKLISRNYIYYNNNTFNTKINKQCKSVDMKKFPASKTNNMLYTKCKISDIKNDDIYSMIYMENKEKLENRINDGFSEQDNKNMFNGKTQIEFKEALDIIHQKLINLDIFDESDDEENNYINGKK